MLTRRSLFARLSAVALAPLVKLVPKEAEACAIGSGITVSPITHLVWKDMARLYFSKVVVPAINETTSLPVHCVALQDAKVPYRLQFHADIFPQAIGMCGETKSWGLDYREFVNEVGDSATVEQVVDFFHEAFRPLVDAPWNHRLLLVPVPQEEA